MAAVLPTSVAIPAVSSASNCRSVEASGSGVAVTWFTPDNPEQRSRIDEWCRAVGPVIASPDASPVPVLESPFVVVTWNMNVGDGDLHRVVADLKAGRFAGGPVTQFALLIQEALRTGGAVPTLSAHARVPKRLGHGDGFEIQMLARELNLNLVYAPAMRNGQGQEDRGNAILSTLPLNHLTVIELPIERQRRVAVAATAHATNRDGTPWAMRLVSVHLETRAGALRRGPASARRRQAEFLVQALAESSGPMVVAGDFNTSWGDDEPAVKALRRAYPDAPRVRGTTWGKAFISAKLDHVFARVPNATVQVFRVEDRYGSDHFPLAAVLKR